LNVILIIADTLRYKNCGFNGYKPEYSENKASPTPNLDKITEKSVIFDNFFTQINCTHPSFTTMLSSRYPVSHTIISHASLHEIIDGVTMFPQILRDNGIKTVAVDNMYRWFLKGFQDYIHPIGEHAIRNTFSVDADKVVDKAIDWLKVNTDDKDNFFMMLHFWDPHVPYLPPKKYEGIYYNGNPRKPNNPNYPSMDNVRDKLDLIFKGFTGRWKGIKDSNWFRAQYDSEIVFMDEEIGRFINFLENSNLLDDTLIIFTADHGEALGEHEIYFTHVHLYDEMMSIPLFIRYPKQFNKNGRRKALIGNVDLAPTILELYGIDIPDYFEGKSFLQVLEGKTDTHSDKLYMFEHEAISRRGIRTSKWKFIKNARENEEENVESRLQALGYISIALETPEEKELYDLENDPDELTNVIEKYTDVAQELEDDLENFVSNICERIGIEDPQQEQELEPWGDFENVKEWVFLLSERNKKFKDYDP